MMNSGKRSNDPSDPSEASSNGASGATRNEAYVARAGESNETRNETLIPGEGSSREKPEFGNTEDGHSGEPLLPTRKPSWAVVAYQVSKTYGRGAGQVRALRDVTVGFERGKLSAIMGPSGSGKSTLMHCMAGLDRVNSGRVLVGGTDITNLDDDKITTLRREKIGFVFQSFNLVPALNAIENIRLPLDMAGRRVDKAWLDFVVGSLEIGNRLKHRPSELSGGQQQRVAVARALISKPAVIFADEPTGNLDSHASEEILTLLRRSVDEMKQTVIIITHESATAEWADRIVWVRDGSVERAEVVTKRTPNAPLR